MFLALKEKTSNQGDEFVICTESESQGFPVGEEGAVNGEEKQPGKMSIWENEKEKRKKQTKKVKPPGTEEKIEVSPCKSLGKEKVDCLY